MEGVELINKLSFSEAKAALTRAIELDKNFAMAYYHLAYVNIFLGDATRTQEAFGKAWQLRNRAAEPDRIQIEAMYHFWIHADAAKAAEVLETLLQNYPHYQEAYGLLAVAYDYLCEFEKAKQALLSGLKNDSLNKLMWNQVAYEYAGLNQRKEAFEAVDRYLKIAPGEPNPYDSKGEIYFWFGDVDSAIYWYKKSNSFRITFSASKLAYNALLQQDYQSAQNYFQRLASGTVSDRAEADNAFALISMHQGKLRTAQKELLKNLSAHQAQEIRAGVIQDCSYLTIVSYELRDYQSMREFAQKRSDELKLRRDFVYGRDILAWAWLKKGDVAKSNALMEEIRNAVKGKMPWWQVSLDYTNALASFEEGKYANSVGLFGKAFDRICPNRAPNYHYGVALIKTGRTSEGIRELERVSWWSPILWSWLNVSFTNSYWPIAAVKAHYWLGVAYEEQGSKDKAIKQYETFLNIWKNADFDSPELSDAKARLGKLRNVK